MMRLPSRQLPLDGLGASVYPRQAGYYMDNTKKRTKRENLSSLLRTFKV